MKKKELFIREFVRTIHDDDLKFLCTRLIGRYGGDVGDASELLSEFPEMDRVLLSAKDCFGFYDLIDEVQTCAEEEYQKRQETN